MEGLKKLRNKLVLAIIMIILGCFVLAKPVEAKSFLKTVGGKLLEPICDLMVFLGDCTIDALQINFLTDQRAIVQANSAEERSGISGWTIVKYVGGALAIVAGVAITVLSFGTLTAAGVAAIAGGVALAAAGTASVVWGIDDTVEALSGEFDLPMIAYTPFAIFSNSIPIFDINFFSPKTETSGNVDMGEENAQIEYTSESSAKILQPTVASWYLALRNIAFVALLSILLYIGIRIVITASSNEKAKYKQMLLDWLVAMCLLFGMHYIMAFTITFAENISSVLAGACTETILVALPDDTKVDGEQLEADPETGHPIWACSFTGYARLIAGGFMEYDTMKAVEFTVIYVVLVIYTVVFSIIYLKRVLYMAFLTIIAPLVAMTYPIDKINDGKAQGFNSWFREYIFNALLQPFHLLIYSVVIGTVMNIAIDYPIYALVALGFLIPAEKMLRKMFGFEKAQSPATMGAMGAAGAGLIMSGIKKLTHKPKRMDNGDNKSNVEKDSKIRMKYNEKDELDTYANENASIGDVGALGLGISSGLKGLEGNKESEENNKKKNEKAPLTGTLDIDNNFSSGYMERNGYGVPKNLTASNVPTMEVSRPKKTIKNRIGNGIMSVGARYSRKISKAHPIKALRRGVAYGFGAASLGLVGLTAGIASGDAGKAAQYMTGAAYVGGNLSKNISDSIANEGNDNIEAFKAGYYGEDYDGKMLEEQIKKMQADPSNRLFLKERGEDYNKILKEVYPDYARNGCMNMDDFYAAYKLEESGLSRDSAIFTYKLAQKVGDVSASPDAEAKWQKRLQEEFSQTPAIKARQEATFRTMEEKYKQEIEKTQQEYEESRRKLEASERTDIEDVVSKLEEKRKEQLEYIKRRQKEEQEDISKRMSEDLAKSAMKNIKQFYKNK